MPEPQPATKKCKYCKSEIPADAKICPNCRKRQTPSGCLIAIIVVVVLIIFAAVAGSSSSGSSSSSAASSDGSAVSDSNSSSTGTATATPTEPPTVYGIGETAESKDVKVTLLNAETSEGAQYVTPSDGNIFIALEFEIENDSSSDINVISIASFEAYCDDYSINESLSVNVLYDNKNTLDGSVAAGKKMNGIIGYEVPKDWKELEVTFTPSFWSNRSVTFVVTNG